MDSSKKILRSVLSYGIGNGLNTVAMVLLLPSLAYINTESSLFAAQGMLAAQVVSLFAAYTFSVTAPRALVNLDEAQKQVFLFELITFQILLGFLGIGILYLIQKKLSIPSLYGFFIFYSTVLQWQWLHISNKTFFIQASLILVSRSFIIVIETIALLNGSFSNEEFSIFYPLVTVLFCVPILPTFFIIQIRAIHENYIKINLGSTIFNEVKSGRHLFIASLLSSIYILGPSLVVAQINPPLLVLIQQFDRVRLAVANMAGMFLSAIYPFFIRNSEAQLFERFRKLQKFILVPIIFLNVFILVVITIVPFNAFTLLIKLQMTRVSLTTALIAGFFAAASSALAMTFIHPMSNDRAYLRIIFIGAVIFIVGACAACLYSTINEIGNYLMITVVATEGLINILLWRKGKTMLNEYDFRKT